MHERQAAWRPGATALIVMGALAAAWSAAGGYGTPGIDAAQQSPENSHGRAAPGLRINLNTARAEELELLPGVGPSLARRIVEYRAQHGAFTSVEQLTNVRGIGQRTLQRLRDAVIVERADAEAESPARGE
jgi:competence protein ComEA